MPGEKSPWVWVPTLYLAEGLPYALVLAVAVVLYKNLGVPNQDIALYTSLLYLPWTIKPLWSPVVDLLRTRRLWIWSMQLTVATGLACAAFAIPGPHFLVYTLGSFWLVAFASATHDIAADGFYLLALPERQQAFFSGVRNTFYRVANISAQGGLIMLVGTIHEHTSSYVIAWRPSFCSSRFTTASSCPGRRRIVMPPWLPGKPCRQILPSRSLSFFASQRLPPCSRSSSSTVSARHNSRAYLNSFYSTHAFRAASV